MRKTRKMKTTHHTHTQRKADKRTDTEAPYHSNNYTDFEPLLQHNPTLVFKERDDQLTPHCGSVKASDYSTVIQRIRPHERSADHDARFVRDGATEPHFIAGHHAVVEENSERHKEEQHVENRKPEPKGRGDWGTLNERVAHVFVVVIVVVCCCYYRCCCCCCLLLWVK